MEKRIDKFDKMVKFHKIDYFSQISKIHKKFNNTNNIIVPEINFQNKKKSKFYETSKLDNFLKIIQFW